MIRRFIEAGVTGTSMKMESLQSGEQYTVLRYRSNGLWDGVIQKRKRENDMVKIYIEDKGQDILWFKVNDGGLVEASGKKGCVYSLSEDGHELGDLEEEGKG